MGYYSINPNIGGTFDSIHEAHDPKKNPVSFRFRVLKPLRNQVENIEINIEGLASVKAYIDKFLDTDENSNRLLIPGNMFSITGDKIGRRALALL